MVKPALFRPLDHGDGHGVDAGTIIAVVVIILVLAAIGYGLWRWMRYR